MPTRIEVNTDIRDKVTSKTSPGSFTNTEDGANRMLMMDYVDQENEKGYKELSFWMTISYGTVTTEEIKNDFTGTTFSYSIPSSGRVQVTASTGVLTVDKVDLKNGAIGTASGGFFCRYVYATTTLGYIYFTRWDNDTTTNPSVSRQKIEIRVYN